MRSGGGEELTAAGRRIRDLGELVPLGPVYWAYWAFILCSLLVFPLPMETTDAGRRRSAAPWLWLAGREEDRGASSDATPVVGGAPAPPCRMGSSATASTKISTSVSSSCTGLHTALLT